MPSSSAAARRYDAPFFGAQGSIAIVSLTNLLIHTPGLERVSAHVPWWAVSTADHIEHHRKLTKFYGAPTLSVDRLLACVVGKPDSWGKEFKDA